MLAAVALATCKNERSFFRAKSDINVFEIYNWTDADRYVFIRNVEIFANKALVSRSWHKHIY